MVAKSPNEVKVSPRSSIYHLATFPVRVHSNSLNLIESSTRVFHEHHKWKVVIWSPRYSPVFPSNLGMFDGGLVGIGGQTRLYWIGSLVNFDRSFKFKVVEKGNHKGP